MNGQHRNAEFPYTRKQWRRAVNLSAVLGWLVIAVPVSARANNASLLQFLAVMAWAAAIGLPIAFLASWLISAPILQRLMRKNISWFQAVLWGAVITFLIALASIVIGRLHGLATLQPSQLGGGDKVRVIDGMLTLYGWQVVAQNTAMFVAAGIVIAAVLRFAIGPGRSIS